MNYPLNEQEKESPKETHVFVTSTFLLTLQNLFSVLVSWK